MSSPLNQSSIQIHVLPPDDDGSHIDIDHTDYHFPLDAIYPTGYDNGTPVESPDPRNTFFSRPLDTFSDLAFIPNNASNLSLNTDFLTPGNFSNYRNQPESPSSPASSVYLDDFNSDFDYDFECPSPSESYQTASSPLLQTPLHEPLKDLRLGPPVARLRSASETGDTISPSAIFGHRGRSSSFNGYGEFTKPSESSASSDVFTIDITAPQTLRPDIPFTNPFPEQYPSLKGHRVVHSEPNIDVSSLLGSNLLSPIMPPTRPQCPPIQTDISQLPQPHSPHIKSRASVDGLLSPDSLHRGRRSIRGASSHPGSRRHSPYKHHSHSHSQSHSPSPSIDFDFMSGGEEQEVRTTLRRHTSLQESGKLQVFRSYSNSSTGSPQNMPNSPLDLAIPTNLPNLVAPIPKQAVVIPPPSPSSSSILIMSAPIYAFPEEPLSGSETKPRKVGSMKIDIASKARRKTAGKFTCDECGKDFTAKHNLKHHMDSHFDIKAYNCLLCPYRAATRATLNRHIKTCQKKRGSPQ